MGLVAIFSVGLAGTAATAYRTSIVAQLFDQARTDPTVWMGRIVNLVLWSQIEVDIAALCANLPAIAGFWRTIRARRKTSTASKSASGYGSAGNSYELRSNRQHGVGATSASAVRGPLQENHLSLSQEHIIPKEDRIVRSTRVDISVH